MNAILVKPDHFSGAGKLFGRDKDGLAAIVRGLAVDNARIAVAVAAIADFTDNSAGTAGASVASVTVPGKVNATVAGVGAKLTDFNTAKNSAYAALVAVAENVNKARARLGLPPLTYTGAPAVSATIPAITTAVAGASGVNAATAVSVAAAIETLRTGLRRVVDAVNEVFVAIGVDPVGARLDGTPVGLVLPVPADGVASANGSDAADAAAAGDALEAFASGIATLADRWNDAFAQTAQATTPLNVIAG
jgi:hypothetical protein